MSWWPFGKDKIETRAAQPYTDLVTNYLTSQALGETTSATTIAAVEAAAGQYARAFAGCEVQSTERVKAALTPSTLSLMARNMIRYGEDVHAIEVMSGELSLIPCGSWTVTGGISEDEWVYNIHIYGPSGNLSSFVVSSSVVHTRYSVDSSRPWNGISPLGWCSSTGRLASNLETKLGDEMSGPVGYVLPIPIDSAKKDDDSGPLDALRADIKNLRGQTVMIESVNNGWSEGKSGAPQKDWVSERIGPRPPDVLATLRSDAGQSILAACGCPPGLFTTDGSAQGSREAWRRFIFGSVEPLARLVEEELTRKLESPVSLSFSGLFAADIFQRANAFSKMVQSGMDATKAAGISGLAVLEE